MAEEIEEDVIGLEAHDAPRISTKMGLNIGDVLEAIVRKIRHRREIREAPLQALIFDSLYDSYRGVIVFCRVKEGNRERHPIQMMIATGASYDVVEGPDISAQASLSPVMSSGPAWLDTLQPASRM